MKKQQVIFILLILLLIQTIALCWLIYNQHSLKQLIINNPLKQEVPGVLPGNKPNLRSEIEALVRLRNTVNEFDVNLTNSGVGPIEEISLTNATKYIQNHASIRHPIDSSMSILFEWPKLIQTMKKTYGVTASQWTDYNFWTGKGLIVYPANYKTDTVPNYQTTAILQLAEKKPDLQGNLEWHALFSTTAKLYDYGDLKPPKNVIK